MLLGVAVTCLQLVSFCGPPFSGSILRDESSLERTVGNSAAAAASYCRGRWRLLRSPGGTHRLLTVHPRFQSLSRRTEATAASDLAFQMRPTVLGLDDYPETELTLTLTVPKPPLPSLAVLWTC